MKKINLLSVILLLAVGFVLSACDEVVVEDKDGDTPQQTTDTYTRSIDDMDMALVPEGEFTMGHDVGIMPHERPAHLVKLSEYWIDQYEVANAQYKLCIEDGACTEPTNIDNEDWNGDGYPAIVTWEQADTYCSWAGASLPTEAQWEKAARGTDERMYPWGDEFDEAKANLSGDGDGYTFSSPVGSFEGDISPYGLYDMAGNAGEWTTDWYDENYYENSPYENPTGPASGTKKVQRVPVANGGGGPQKSRTIARYAADPNWEFGFRCIMDQLPEESQE